MFLSMVKHSRPNTANAAREPTKVIGKATTDTDKELLRCIMFVIDTKDKDLTITPKNDRTWKLAVYLDSH
jgi:hypothetical protein